MKHHHLLAMALLMTPVFGQDDQKLSPLLIGALRKSGLPADQESVVIPLKSSLEGLTLEVRINDKPINLVLDTGASATVLTQEAAEKIGVISDHNSNKKVVDSSGNKINASHASTQRIDLGTAWTENEPVMILKTLPEGIHGLLGMATLADWDIRIDPQANQLTLFPAGKAPAMEGETAIPLKYDVANASDFPDGSRAFRVLNLYIPVLLGRHVIAATPDTGHGGILQISKVMAEEVLPEAMKEAKPGLATGMAISGETISQSIKVPAFTFGPDTLKDMRSGVINPPKGSSLESRGLIGMNLLRHYVMTLSFSKGEFRVKPIGTVQEITQTSTAGINIGPGYKIMSLTPGGPGEKAGLQVGDTLLEIEGHPMKTMTAAQFATFKQLPPGSKGKVLYQRGNDKPVEATLVLVKE